jgi:hypothetical protein
VASRVLLHLAANEISGLCFLDLSDDREIREREREREKVRERGIDRLVSPTLLLKIQLNLPLIALPGI